MSRIGDEYPCTRRKCAWCQATLPLILGCDCGVLMFCDDGCKALRERSKIPHARRDRHVIDPGGRRDDRQSGTADYDYHGWRYDEDVWGCY